MSEIPQDQWSNGQRYEHYVGRWSRIVANHFLNWLSLPPHQAWVDVGCGTGSLVQTILNQSDPAAVTGIDRSEGFLAEARRAITDPRAYFHQGDALALPLNDAACDVAVSGLVLNFVPDSEAMIREMARVTRAGGTVAVYVWDYAEGMEMMRHFWDAAVAVSPQANAVDEAERFPICHPDALAALWQQVGLTSIAVRPIEIPTVFQDFDDYWTPFLGATGPAPTYLTSLNPETQVRIRESLRTRLAPTADGTIALRARAWAVQGRVPPSGGRV